MGLGTSYQPAKLRFIEDLDRRQYDGRLTERAQNTIHCVGIQRRTSRRCSKSRRRSSARTVTQGQYLVKFLSDLTENQSPFTKVGVVRI